MLSGSLDIWSDTHVADPHQLEAIGVARGIPTDPSTLLPDALATARQAQSGVLILGDIVSQAGSLEVIVRLVRVNHQLEHLSFTTLGQKLPVGGRRDVCSPSVMNGDKMGVRCDWILTPDPASRPPE